MANHNLTLTWKTVFYTAAGFLVFVSITRVQATGNWLPLLMLIPMLALLLPPLRAKLDPRARYLPGPPWTLVVAFVLFMVQLQLFWSNLDELVAADKAKLEQASAQRIAKIRSDRLEEYKRNKPSILAQIEGHLASNRPTEALALANTYFTVDKDPDLARLHYRASLASMRLELKNESNLTLARRKEIYTALIEAEPSQKSLYNGKLLEVSKVIEDGQKIETFLLSAKRQFSKYDGSHSEVERAIKARMKNPDSYSHVETEHTVGAEGITVYTKYRGTNSYGGIVTNEAVATVDEDGNVLTFNSR